MDTKRKLITVAVQLVAANTDLIRTANNSTAVFDSFFGFKSEEERIIDGLDNATTKIADTVKKISLNRKFKKVTKNF